jgi:hypothetical protein
MQDINLNLDYTQEEKAKLWFIHHSQLTLVLQIFECSLVCNITMIHIQILQVIAKKANSISAHEYQKTSQKWIEGMKLCIEHYEDYFEHLP